MGNYIVESDFEYIGMRCVVIFGSMGHRCGYVGINKYHPLYEKDYTDNCALLKKSDIEDDEIGDRGIIPLFTMDAVSNCVSPDIYFDVHSGITYAGGNDQYPVNSNLWWFGFDCAHCDDMNDYKQAYEYGLIDSERENYYFDLESRYPTGGIARTKEYVENQCRKLVEQLVRIN